MKKQECEMKILEHLQEVQRIFRQYDGTTENKLNIIVDDDLFMVYTDASCRKEVSGKVLRASIVDGVFRSEEKTAEEYIDDEVEEYSDEEYLDEDEIWEKSSNTWKMHEAGCFESMFH